MEELSQTTVKLIRQLSQMHLTEDQTVGIVLLLEQKKEREEKMLQYLKANPKAELPEIGDYAMDLEEEIP